MMYGHLALVRSTALEYVLSFVDLVFHAEVTVVSHPPHEFRLLAYVGCVHVRWSFVLPSWTSQFVLAVVWGRAGRAVWWFGAERVIGSPSFVASKFE